MAELKPCPFCSEEDIEVFSNAPQGVTDQARCRYCGARGPFRMNSKRAIVAWNRRADGWVSVRERLPGVDEYVLIANAVECWVRDETYAWRDNGFWTTDDALVRLKDMTHWRPLPDPPEAP